MTNILLLDYKNISIAKIRIYITASKLINFSKYYTHNIAFLKFYGAELSVKYEFNKYLLNTRKYLAT